MSVGSYVRTAKEARDTVEVPIFGPSNGQRYEVEILELANWENEGGSTRLPASGTMRPQAGQQG